MSDKPKPPTASAAAASSNLSARAKSARANVKKRRNSASDISKALPATGAKGIENLKAKDAGAAEIENAVTSQPGLDTQPLDTVSDSVNLEFPPELTGWSRVNTPSTDFDCLVHSILIALSPTFRKQPLGVRNAIASNFRRDGLFSKTEGLTDEEAKRIAANQTYLQTSELEKFAKQHGLNFLIVAKTSGATQAGILKTDQKLPGQNEASVLEGKAGAPVYVIYNDNQNHFEAVHGPSGEYSMPYDEAIKIAKNFHKDVPKPSETAPPTATTAPPSPTPSENPGPVAPGSPPVGDDFGFIHLTDNVSPPDVIAHRFVLSRDGDVLKPSMQLMGSDTATPKIESIKTASRERTRAEKKVLKRGDGTSVKPDETIVGAYSDMEIPLFHFASDVEKFLDDPKVVSSSSPTILPPTSPLLKPRDVPSEAAITFNLKSSIPEITFNPSSSAFNNFYVGPVGKKDHRVALHGFLVSPVVAKIKGRGDITLQKGFEMVSVLTGTLGSAPTGTVIMPMVPPETPVLASTPAPAPAPARGRSPTPVPPTTDVPSPFTTEVGTTPPPARSASPPPPVVKLDANKQSVQDIAFQASELVRMEAARDKAEADIAGAGDVSPQRRLQLINIAQQRKKFAADARKKWEATGKKVLDVAEKDHEQVKKAHAKYKATLKEKKDAAKAANDKIAKLEKVVADSKAVLDREVAKGDKSTNKRKEALAKTSVQADKDLAKAKAEATEADADATLWAKDEQKVDEGLANSAKNLEEVRKTVKDPRYVSPTAPAAPPEAPAAPPTVATNPMRDAPSPPTAPAAPPTAPAAPAPPEAPAPPTVATNPMRDAPAPPQRLVNPLAPTPEGLAARASAEQRLGLAAPVVPPVAPTIAPAVAASLDAFNPNAAPPAPAPASAPAPATTGTSVPERTVSIDSGVMTSLDQFAPRRPAYTPPVTEPPAPPVAPSPTNITGTIDDNFDMTFRDAVTKFIKSVDTELNLKLLNDENVEEAFKDKRLTSYIADIKKNHKGQAFTLQFPSHELVKSSAAKGTGWNAGGGDWEIPVERKMGGDTVFISIDKFKYGSTLVKQKKGGARPTGPTFRFEFEMNYPQEKVGGLRRSLKRRRNPATRKTMRR